jgi:putative ABC transport system permease protein
VSPADYYNWRDQTHGFQDLGAWRRWQFNLTGERGELPEMIDAAAGTWNLLPLLGVQPVFGRGFTEAEDKPGGNAVLLSWSIFERRFAGDPSIVGRQIHLDGKPWTVVGVLPSSFTYPDAKVQVWFPYSTELPPAILQHHDFHFTYVMARLRPDVSLASAIGQVETAQYRIHMRYPNLMVAEDAVPRTLTDDLARDVKKPLMILVAAVACMLLIGCLNVANLLVARSAARQKETAIRSALGARQSTLVREQLTESLVICFAGGAIGVLLSFAATKWMANAWRNLPTAEPIHVDVLVLIFACLLVFVTALVAGLLPALSSANRSALELLQASSRGAAGNLSRAALRKTLLAIEIAATVVLLAGAGLLLKSFVRLRNTDVGCTIDRVLTMGYSLPPRKYDKPEKVNTFNEELLARLRALPGVQAIALGSALPGAGFGGDNVFTVVEHPPLKPGEDLPNALYRRADPGYFSGLQIPLVGGRFFSDQDRLNRPRRMIVSQQLAHEYFPGEDPVGRHLHVPGRGDADYEIVGVVGDTLWKVGEPSRATMYFPLLAGDSDVGLSLAVRASGEPLALSVPIQKVFAELDPELPVSDVLTLQQVIGDSLGNASFSAAVVLAFAVLSLVLASAGLYGVLSYLMTQRTTEIGIRIALGARRGQVIRLMLRDGLTPAIAGLAFGLFASAAVTRLIKSMLYHTGTLDPSVFFAVSAMLLVVAGLACAVPAWRASRLDPVQALRNE